jgi:hypothetical protein
VGEETTGFRVGGGPQVDSGETPETGGGGTPQRPAPTINRYGYSYAIAFSTLSRAARIAGITAAPTPTTAAASR